jgi:Ca2+-binding RTX toxin-like protein
MKMKNTSTIAPNPRAQFPRPLVSEVESLESRRLMASVHAVITGGILHVTGTEGADTISMKILPGHILSLTVNGSTKNFGNIANTGLDHTEIMLLGGNDRVTVGAGVGNVYANGGSGNDTLTGGDGSDTLTGAGGADFLNGGKGRDLLNGNAGNDQLLAGRDVDRVFGGDGNDSIDGQDGSDYLWGENGNDTIFGSSGSDSLDGAGGNDSLDGGDGDDTIVGGSGADNLTGGSGHDTVFGNSGDDRLNLRDLTSDLADGGTGTDWSVIDDFERSYIIAEVKMQ